MTYLTLMRRIVCCSLLFGASAFAADSLAPRDPAPDFNLTSQSGSQVSLKSYKGSWVILFFFGDHSSEDVRLEARNLQKDLAKFDSYHAVVVGIGRTSPESNRIWADKDGLTFTLLSDLDQTTAKAYAVPADGSKSAGDGGIYEMIVTPDGRVKLPRIVTNDVDEESNHLLACLQYFKDLAARAAS
jgi:thioredoxin-dependent peroxiredoxin